jgi:two-component system NarL family sensor kinase
VQKNTNDIIIFLLVASALILTMAVFIVMILYVYRKKQILFVRDIEQIKLNHEKTIVEAQLEMQESTFQHISREIHDNINLSLTLAKLQLNTLNWNNQTESEQKLKTSIELLGLSIKELSAISKGLNTDLIKQQGLVNALRNEIRRIRQTGLFTIDTIVTGNTVYLDAEKELIIFRMVQEAFNNILKHADARHAELSFNYTDGTLYIAICDDGKGFEPHTRSGDTQAGLKNMTARIKMLGGVMDISSEPGQGTLLTFIIPCNEYAKRKHTDQSSDGR